MIQKQDILNYLIKSNQEYYYNQFGVKFIGLFGSFARGGADKNSNIDILYKIEKGKKLSIFKYLKLNRQFEEFFQKKIDLVRDEALKPQLRNYIQRDLNYV